MSQEQTALHVGHEMGELLLPWRPEMSPEDVSSATMHALEHYSIQLERPRECGIMACLYKLKRMIDERLMSI